MIFPRDCVELETGCWVIQRLDGEPNLKDHFKLWYEGELWAGYRLAYSLNVNLIPCKSGSRTEGLVLHTCDFRPCIRPSHLYLGTQSQNLKDMWERNEDFRIKQAQSLRKPKSEEHRKAASKARKFVGNGPWSEKRRAAQNQRKQA